MQQFSLCNPCLTLCCYVFFLLAQTPGTVAELSFDDLGEVGSKLADSLQSGNIEEAIKVEVVSMEVKDPQPPPVDPTGGVRATEETGGPETGDKT